MSFAEYKLVQMLAENHFARSSEAALIGKDTLDLEEDLPVSWSAEQAQSWRQSQRPMPLWLLVAVQFGVGLAAAVVAYALFGTVAGLSAGYGALCAALPSALLVRGMRSALSQANPVVGFMVWELVKIVLSVAMLVAAPNLLSEVNWFALLIGLVLTLKVVFLAALWPSKATAQHKDPLVKSF